MGKASLYILEFSDGKIYVGITTQRLTQRIANHRYAASHGGKSLVNRAWRSLGEPRIVEVAEGDLEQIKDLERGLTLHLNSVAPAGYNRRVGGSHNGAHSAETKQHLSSKLKGRKLGPVSEETRRRMSEAARRRNARMTEEERVRRAELGRKNAMKRWGTHGA
jgi:hypothetical protein